MLLYLYVSIKFNNNYQDMRLTHLALLAIKGSDGGIQRLMEALGVSRPTIYKYIRGNTDELTKAAAMKVIREITGLSDDQILEVEKVTA